ncbi:unnamed protein product [Laminaria digitata]
MTRSPCDTCSGPSSTVAMTIYALGGVSGTGKTHFRTTCDCLRGLRTLDIADVYEDSIAEGTPDLHWKTALERFAGRVRGLLEEDSSSDLVLEAFFRPDGEQRRVIASLAQTYGTRVRWGWAYAPREDCLSRLANEVGGHDSAERVEKRISFIRSAEPMFFLARPTESLERIAGWAGAPAHDS